MQRRGQGRESRSGGVGEQLSRKVASGEITQAQAKKTARERQTFKAAYGSDWRSKVFGQGGAKSISGPFAPADARTKRSGALAAARSKLQGSSLNQREVTREPKQRAKLASAKKARRSKIVGQGDRIYLGNMR